MLTDFSDLVSFEQQTKVFPTAKAVVYNVAFFKNFILFTMLVFLSLCSHNTRCNHNK